MTVEDCPRIVHFHSVLLYIFDNNHTESISTSINFVGVSFTPIGTYDFVIDDLHSTNKFDAFIFDHSPSVHQWDRLSQTEFASSGRVAVTNSTRFKRALSIRPSSVTVNDRRTRKMNRGLAKWINGINSRPKSIVHHSLRLWRLYRCIEPTPSAPRTFRKQRVCAHECTSTEKFVFLSPTAGIMTSSSLKTQDEGHRGMPARQNTSRKELFSHSPQVFPNARINISQREQIIDNKMSGDVQWKIFENYRPQYISLRRLPRLSLSASFATNTRTARAAVKDECGPEVFFSSFFSNETAIHPAYLYIVERERGYALCWQARGDRTQNKRRTRYRCTTSPRLIRRTPGDDV